MNRNRGRGPRAGRSSRDFRYGRTEAGENSTNDSFGCKDGTPPNRSEASKQPSPGSISMQYERGPRSGYSYKQDGAPAGNKEGLFDIGRNKCQQNPLEVAGNSSQSSGCSFASDSTYGSDLDRPSLSDLSIKENTNNMLSQDRGTQCGKTFLKNTMGTRNTDLSDHSEHPALVEPFDICPIRTGTSVVLKAPLLLKNREKRRAAEGQQGTALRHGMILLKNYISLSNQVKIVKKCRELGLVSGGFYSPGYRDGAKLNLKMMCLGKNWDPETSKYGHERPFDNAKPPSIPNEFSQFVEQAIQDSHMLLLKEKTNASNVEEILPRMTPDICIVNFYTTSGRLGLHQDRDESERSLRNGLPVVSFSIGDSANFLYGDQRDIHNAKKVLLESGDVLIFGGKSRNIFHGVDSVIPNTAPKALLEETNLRPGRLNLTFRKY